ncbi:hyaluronan and proteoglycan link protein 1-like isoform X3 [Branchiostoma floridae x Branchiostoma japonicum]
MTWMKQSTHMCVCVCVYKEAVAGIQSAKVLQSGPEDNVFVFFTDHGAPNLIAFLESEQGATLASYHQLYEAWQDGLDHCACGWLTDGTARYPTQTARTGCGAVDINLCDWRSTYDAWCFRKLSICD